MKTLLSIIMVPLCWIGMNILSFFLSFPLSVKLGRHHADRLTRYPRFTLRAFFAQMLSKANKPMENTINRSE